MPFKDDEKRRDYYRAYRAAKRQAAREALPDPERPDPWPHQRDLYQVLESPDPPRLLTVRKGARVGLTTVQLLLADAAARRSACTRRR